MILPISSRHVVLITLLRESQCTQIPTLNFQPSAYSSLQHILIANPSRPITPRYLSTSRAPIHVITLKLCRHVHILLGKYTCASRFQKQKAPKIATVKFSAPQTLLCIIFIRSFANSHIEDSRIKFSENPNSIRSLWNFDT